MRYFIELAYRGTNYHGWQIQPNAVTVQSKLEEALSVILREDISVIGAGRTDTGVHASYFVAHFDTKKPVNDEMVYKLNGYLPPDITVYDVRCVSKDAHARFDALSRTYRYLIVQKKHPFAKGLTTFIPYEINVDRLNEASTMLLNFSDFTTFSKLHSTNKTNLCRIDAATWTTNKGFLIFTITADRFLRNMVRSVVGTLLEAGRGKITPGEFSAIIESRDRSGAGTSAP
ncbi:MAG TPA: tRNA pseudouridine(38-40) synthase TruA, partial [Bacteroidales bacterium]|nr:tRNA pseudouridine(38-40) synthase TruA [Bacteroidales bacterium]